MYSYCEYSYLRRSHPLREDVSWNVSDAKVKQFIKVILFVRMWVEMEKEWTKRSVLQSSSSWGCELKYDEDKNAHMVSLSSSSWGCELKYYYIMFLVNYSRHPLREDVSWNIAVSEFSITSLSHPLREDVSWNGNICRVSTSTIWSSSSWGCELKCIVTSAKNMIGASSSSWGCELK